MNQKHRSAILLGLLGIVLIAAGQEQGPARLTKAQALKDTRALVQLLEASHPDPYINMGGKVEFKRRALELERSLPAEGLTVAELRSRLAEFLAGLRDGHTFLNPGRDDPWRDTSLWLPVDFSIVSDGLVIIDSDLPQLEGCRGGRLLAVNGHGVRELLDMMSRQFGAENDYSAYGKLSNTVRSFKFMKNFFPDLDRSGGIVYRLELPDGRSADRTIPWDAKSQAELQAWWMKKFAALRGGPGGDSMFSFRFIDHPAAACFRVAAIMGREAYEMALRENVGDAREMMADYYRSQKKDMPADLEAALRGIPSFFEAGQELLREMKTSGTRHLIIDLRGNSGGWTPMVFPFLHLLYGDAYYGHRSQARWVTVESELYLKKNNATVEEWRKRKGEPDFEVGKYRFEEETAGSAEEKRREAVDGYLQKGYSFAGALKALGGSPLYTPPVIIVLCDPGTYSAAFHFMFYLKELGARIVGVPSSQAPNTFMEVTPFTLPESGISGSISNSAQIFIPDNPRADVLRPDFEVNYEILKQYGFESDATLKYALDLIASGKL